VENTTTMGCNARKTNKRVNHVGFGLPKLKEMFEMIGDRKV
jgi:hypothetical protein